MKKISLKWMLLLPLAAMVLAPAGCKKGPEQGGKQEARLFKPGDISAWARGTQITVSWGASQGALRYVIDIAEDETFDPVVKTATVDAETVPLEHKFSELKENTLYQIRIKATNDNPELDSRYTYGSVSTTEPVSNLDAEPLFYNSVKLTWYDIEEEGQAPQPLVGDRFEFITDGEQPLVIDITMDDLNARTKTVTDDGFVAGAAYIAVMMNEDEEVTRSGEFTMPEAPEEGSLLMNTGNYADFPVAGLPQHYKDILEGLEDDDAPAKIDFNWLLRNAPEGQLFIFSEGVYDLRSQGVFSILTDVTVKGAPSGSRPVFATREIYLGPQDNPDAETTRITTSIGEITFEYIDFTGLAAGRTGLAALKDVEVPTNNEDFQEGKLSGVAFMVPGNGKKNSETSIDKLNLKDCVFRHFAYNVISNGYANAGGNDKFRLGELNCEGLLVYDICRNVSARMSVFQFNQSNLDSFCARINVKNSTFHNFYKGMVEQRGNGLGNDITAGPEYLFENVTIDLQGEYYGADVPYGTSGDGKTFFQFTGMDSKALQAKVTFKKSLIGGMRLGFGPHQMAPAFASPSVKATNHSTIVSWEDTWTPTYDMRLLDEDVDDIRWDFPRPTENDNRNSRNSEFEDAGGIEGFNRISDLPDRLFPNRDSKTFEYDKSLVNNRNDLGDPRWGPKQ